jgi:hypothetical protein
MRCSVFHDNDTTRTRGPSWSTLLILLITLFNIFPLTSADAAFEDVRTNLAKSRAGRRGDPNEKYFHESTFHPHYDGRFASHALPTAERLPHLTDLIRTFLSTAKDLGVEVWLMHGSLLGWWWNQKILPWDSDLDLQVSLPTMTYLAKFYNMTEYHFRFPHNRRGRTYLLEVNPRYVNGSVHDHHNVIDARWIDTETGLFIDLSTVRVDVEWRKRGVEGALMCKDHHRYQVSIPMTKYSCLLLFDNGKERG